MKTFELDGSSVAIAGKVSGHTRETLEALIESMGGRVVASVRAGADALLVGSNPAYRELWDARENDIVVLHDAQVAELIERGEVSWREPEPSGSFGQAVAQARGLLGEEPTLEVWGALADLVDACEADYVDDLVAYLAPHLAAWPRAPRVHRYMLGSMPAPAGIRKSGGDVRIMPPGWLRDMVAGKRHQKHALCTQLSYNVANLDNPSAVRLLDNPDLASVRTLDLSTYSPLRKNHYKKLASSPHLGSVDTLVVGHAMPGAFAPLAKATSLPNLRRLMLHSSMELMDDQGASALRGPWDAQLEYVGVTLPAQLEALARDVDAFPSLQTLAIGDFALDSLLNLRCRPDGPVCDAYCQDLFARMTDALGAVLPRVRTLRIGVLDYRAPTIGHLGVLLGAVDGDLDVLDLSGCVLENYDEDLLRDFVYLDLIDSGLASRVGSLVLPELAPRYRTALADNGAHISS